MTAGVASRSRSRGVDNIDTRTFIRILRIEGLIPFTGVAIVLGGVVTLWEAGTAGTDWGLFTLAAIAALLIHIDAHIWNDIMDLEIEWHEKSEETGRDRPLVFGWATVGDYRRFSAVVTVILLVLGAYLTAHRIWIPLLLFLGFIFDYGYNHPRFALAYKPFTEWYIFPWLVVGVTVTVVYAATGIFSLLAFIVSVLHGLTVTCFVVSMMRRDTNSDRRGDKFTSSVLFPALPHAAIYGIVTLVASLLAYFPLAQVLGNPAAAALIVLSTAIIAGVNIFLGAGVDRLSTRNLHTVFPGFEKETHGFVMKQVGVSMVYSVVITGILLSLRRMI